MSDTQKFIELARTKCSDTDWKPLGAFCYDFGVPALCVRIIFTCWRNLSQRLDAIEAKLEALSLPTQDVTPLSAFPTQDVTPLKTFPVQQ